ncbi:phosphonoacetate hydrolase [Alphaproteobacteria bacterium]|jgi:phosphonoacetate hydrolase|nr:phosphonoacetate hydrolase [Alphaproteobacteria bacterium]
MNLEINQRNYPSKVNKPVVVICLDGSQKEYLDIASKENLTPNLDKIINEGEFILAHSAIPSFTNPNNISIVTGQPSAVHGICGNFFYTPSTGEEVMMNDPQYLRAPTIFQKFYEQGAKIAVITAKDKLRSLLGNGLKFNENKAICFSSEKSDQTTLEQNGIEKVNEWLETPVPEVYSQDLSEFVMKAGVKILNEFKPDIMYLSTTDFIQHKYEPGHEIANQFYQMFDHHIGLLNDNDISLVITADHGMKAKTNFDGEPNAIFLEDLLNKKFPQENFKVILPITDPYVVHHGSLGSFAMIYVENQELIHHVLEEIKKIPEIEEVLNKQDACKAYHLPEDRSGDIVCMSSESFTIGSSKSKHDLSSLKEPLRSHGGLHEREVPFILNSSKSDISKQLQIYNYDAFYYATHMANK